MDDPPDYGERAVAPGPHRRGFALDDAVWMGAPRLRLRERYHRVTRWVVPVVVIVVAVVVGARALTSSADWKEFYLDNPCLLSKTSSIGFPAWLRAMHWFNVLLVLVLLRSGIHILADHPRLYWTIHSTPQKEWLRFRGPVRQDRVWTALDDSTYLSPAWGLPSGRHTSGMARHWHFLSVPLWVLLGAAFIVLIFATGQWERLVPTSLEIVPGAVSCGVTYASLQVPEGVGGASYNSLQLLAYFAVVFIVAPLQILTGLAMSPGISHRAAWYERLFGNRQIARSIHFLGWCFLAVFIVVHVTLVVVTDLRQNMNHMVFGTDDDSWGGVVLGALIVAAIVGLLALAHWLSWNRPRSVQHAFVDTADRFNGLLFDRTVPRVEFKDSDISPYLWTNGHPPISAEFDRLVKEGFVDYRLRVYGLVDDPREFTLEELKALPKHQQITEHVCVQGWSGVAEWGGVRVSDVLDIVQPQPEARYAVFHAFSDEARAIDFYDAHDLAQLRQPTSILAYEMNYQPLPLQYGAPLRLRNENQLGFKHVKWIESIELVHTFAADGLGEGGFREDNEFVGRRAEI